MVDEIKKIFKGEVVVDSQVLDKYSHDASLLEVMPEMVVYPHDSSDIQGLVKYVLENKDKKPNLSITVRAAGSCMAGSSLNESIILDVMKHMGGITGFDGQSVTVLPGTFYRDFEVETLKRNLILPCFTASKNLNAIGGMIGNNSGGEKTLQYGKMENYIETLKIVLSDGKEYEVEPLSKDGLKKKMEQNDFEGGVYKKIFTLIESNKEEIEKARPTVSKNSAGYYIWNVLAPDNEEVGNNKYFDLTKLIVGSEGTLGIVTEAKLKLVPVKKKSKLFVVFLKDLSPLADLVNEILVFKPESLESYDDATMKLAIRFFPEMVKSMKVKNFFKLLWSFLPEAWLIISGGVPKLIVLAEFSGDTDEEIDSQMGDLKNKLAHFRLKTHIAKTEEESEKYWTIRRESFNLLRKHVKGKRTAPFVDDVIVEPKYLPEFLPQMRAILDNYKLDYTIAGHAGNGNFHIIPLMDMKDKKNVNIIMEVSEKIYDLVVRFHGSITAEHNDGIIRTPYLSKMFSPKMLEIFKEIKKIFDSRNIFNPGKKVPYEILGKTMGDLEYLKNHLASK